MATLFKKEGLCEGGTSGPALLRPAFLIYFLIFSLKKEKVEQKPAVEQKTEEVQKPQEPEAFREDYGEPMEPGAPVEPINPFEEEFPEQDESKLPTPEYEERLKEGEELVLRYGVMVWDGTIGAEEIAKAREAWIANVSCEQKKQGDR